MQTKIEIPEELISYVFKKYGLDLKKLLLDSEPIAIKRALKSAVLELHPDNHYPVEQSLTIDKGIQIIIDSKSPRKTFRLFPPGNTNIIPFQIFGLSFSKARGYVLGSAYFYAHLDSLMEAIK